MKLNVDSVVCPHCRGPVVSSGGYLHGESQDARLSVNLTRCERVVYLLLCSGLSNKQIAGQLVVSENTVRFHLKQLYAKLGARSRVHAVTLGSSASFDLAEPA